MACKRLWLAASCPLVGCTPLQHSIVGSTFCRLLPIRSVLACCKLFHLRMLKSIRSMERRASLLRCWRCYFSGISTHDYHHTDFTVRMPASRKPGWERRSTVGTTEVGADLDTLVGFRLPLIPTDESLLRSCPDSSVLLCSGKGSTFCRHFAHLFFIDKRFAELGVAEVQ